MTEPKFAVVDARQHTRVARRQLERAQRVLSTEYPEVAALTDDILVELDALADVLEELDSDDDRWEDAEDREAKELVGR